MSNPNLDETRRQLEEANRLQKQFGRIISRIHPENTGPTDFLELQKMLTAIVEANEELIRNYQQLIDMHQELLDRLADGSEVLNG